MEAPSIGITIANLRKSKNVKQEELANFVGVSTQAVSKWENGGMPDCELLPRIADFFNVSIDTLFSRHIEDYDDLKNALARIIASFDQEKRFEIAMEYCWIIGKALGGAIGSEKTLKEDLDIIDDGYQHSQMIFQSGFSTFSLMKKLPYFFILPEPSLGWKNGLFEKERYEKFFKLLGDRDIMNCLFLLYERENKPFTPKLLEDKLKITEDRAKQILDELKSFALIKETEIELDDATKIIYNFIPNPSFIALLAITTEMIKRPNAFVYYCESRSGKSYL